MNQSNLIIIEDNPEQAEDYANEINEGEIVTNVVLIHSLRQFHVQIPKVLGSNFSNFYVVDISLDGPGNTDGLSIIEEIRFHDPDSYIVAYSAQHQHGDAAKEKGADIFLKKSGRDYDFHMESIREFIEQKIREIGSWVSELKIHCKILDINEESKKILLRLLDPNNPEQYSDKIFPLSDFEQFGDLFVNKPILIQVLTKGNKRIREIKELKYSGSETITYPEIETMDDIFSQ